MATPIPFHISNIISQIRLIDKYSLFTQGSYNSSVLYLSGIETCLQKGTIQSMEHLSAKLSAMFSDFRSFRDPEVPEYREAVRMERLVDQLHIVDESSQQWLHRIDVLWEHPSSYFFRYPVSSNSVPDYYTKIQEPMSLAVMYEKARQGLYGQDSSSADDSAAAPLFKNDIEKIVRNCVKYNGESATISVEVGKLKQYMEKLFGRHPPRFPDVEQLFGEPIAQPVKPKPPKLLLGKMKSSTLETTSVGGPPSTVKKAVTKLKIKKSRSAIEVEEVESKEIAKQKGKKQQETSISSAMIDEQLRILDHIKSEDHNNLFVLDTLKACVEKGKYSKAQLSEKIQNMFQQYRANADAMDLAYQECIRLERMTDAFHIDDEEKLLCLSQIDWLWTCKNAELFRYPVSDRLAPRYSKIIRDPMSLTRMYERAREGSYGSVDTLLSDVEKIWANCAKYNGKEADITNKAHLFQVNSTRLKRRAPQLSAVADVFGVSIRVQPLQGVDPAVQEKQRAVLKATPTKEKTRENRVKEAKKAVVEEKGKKTPGRNPGGKVKRGTPKGVMPTVEEELETAVRPRGKNVPPPSKKKTLRKIVVPLEEIFSGDVELSSSGATSEMEASDTSSSSGSTSSGSEDSSPQHERKGKPTPKKASTRPKRESEGKQTPQARRNRISDTELATFNNYPAMVRSIVRSVRSKTKWGPPLQKEYNDLLSLKKKILGALERLEDK